MEGDEPNIRHLIKSFSSALKQRDSARISALLNDEAVLARLKRERTFEPFVLAIRSNCLDAFDLLLRKGFRLGARLLDEADEAAATASAKEFSKELVEAIKLSNYEAVALLINLSVNVNSTNYNQIPLQVAYNQYSSERDRTPEPGAASSEANPRRQNCLDIFKLMIKSKANPNIYNQKGLRLVHQICLDKDLALLTLLIETFGEEFNVNALTWHKMQNPLHLVCEPAKNRTEADLALDVKMARLLIDSGCDLNHRDRQHLETPIFRALVANNFEICRLLVVEGVDLSLRNAFGNDPLSRSIQLGRFRIARFLTLASLAFRAYSCIYKLPNVDDMNRYSTSLLNPTLAAQMDDLFNWQHGPEPRGAAESANQFRTNESFLQYTLSKYEEFLKFLEAHLRQPRRLTDLCRLNVRNYMRKPVSKWAGELKLPRHVQDLVLLNDLSDIFPVVSI